MRSFGFLLVLLAALSNGLAERALAQDGGPSTDPSASELSVAREQFQAGLRFAEEGQWEQAYEAFERAYRITRRPLVLLNLASAQTQTGRLVEAAQNYRTFLRDPAASSEESLRAAAEQALQDVDRRIPRVTLQVADLREGDLILLDNGSLSAAVVGQSVPMNPGSHTVRVVNGELTLGTQTFTVTEGSQTEVAVSLERPAPPIRRRLDDPPPPPPRKESTVWSSPWLWTAVGAVVVGGAVTAIVLSTSSSGSEPYSGSLGRFTFE